MTEKKSVFSKPHFYAFIFGILLIPVLVGFALIIFGFYLWSLDVQLNKAKLIEGFNSNVYYQNNAGEVISMNPEQRNLIILTNDKPHILPVGNIVEIKLYVNKNYVTDFATLKTKYGDFGGVKSEVKIEKIELFIATKSFELPTFRMEFNSSLGSSEALKKAEEWYYRIKNFI
jgi:hypothetical protein